MPLTRIFVEDQELTLVKETLTIQEDNNSFSTSFSIPRSSNPFLVVNDKVAQEVFNIRSLQSVGRKLFVDCKVQQGSIIYSGQIIVKQVFSHTIKCDVTHSSDLFPILKENIRQFMPILSVNNDATPEDYVSEQIGDIDDSGWDAFALENRYNSFPNNDFCLPWIEHKDRFGEDLVIDEDDWWSYGGTLNRFNLSTGVLLRNFQVDADWDIDSSTPDTRRFFNRNVISPCVFILSPLRHALASIGYSFKGSFVDRLDVQSTHFISEKDQLTKILSSTDPEFLTFTDRSYLASDLFTIPASTVGASPVQVFVENDTILIAFQITEIGTYDIDIEVDASNTNFTQQFPLVYVHKDTEFIYSNGVTTEGQIPGSTFIEAGPEDIGKFIFIRYFQVGSANIVPISSQITISFSGFKNSIYRFNNTIELGRFIPDITLADYINWLQNWRNLKVSIDDVKKQVTLDHNEEFIIQSNSIAIENLRVNTFTPAPNDSFLLKYDGDDPDQLLVRRNELSTTDDGDDNTKTIPCRVKITPFNGITHELNNDFLDSNGFAVGMFNVDSGIPYSSVIIDGKTLDLSGDGGVYNTDHRTWLKFRINASEQNITIPLSSYQLQEIREVEKLYFNNQLYLIKSFRAIEKTQEYEVSFTLESVNF